jgi:hypothetical protein
MGGQLSELFCVGRTTIIRVLRAGLVRQQRIFLNIRG